MQARDIAIIGYGTAGQACALVLARQGHRVHVFERVSHPGPVGAGFLLQPTGLQALWAMGLLADVLAHGVQIARLYGETPNAHAVMDMRYAQLDTRLFGLGMQRGALFSVLDRAIEGSLELHADAHVDEVDVERGWLRDRAGHRQGPFDLVVVADGAGSRLRSQVCRAQLEKPYPWGALWCLLPASTWPWRDELRQRYRLAREMVGMLPVGTRPGDDTPMLSFFWSLPTSQFTRWREQGAAFWLDQVRALWPQAHACLGDAFDVTRLAQAQYRDAVLPRWWNGRAVLAGDAAHAMSPQLGQGANMALVDAVCLGDALRRHCDLADALHHYDVVRRRHLAAYHRWSRWLTPIFQSDVDALARLRDAAFHPLGRLPGARGHMLRVLTGTQQGWFGSYALQPEFVAALHDAHASVGMG